MCRAQCVLAVVALYVGVVHSWDIAVSVGDQLIFYTNGTETNTVRLKSQNFGALAYDEVHNVMLYVDKQSNNDTICGYNIPSMKNKCYIKRNGRNIHSIAYDPVTEKVFFTDTNERSINWISLKRGSNNHIYGNLLIKMDDRTPADITLDICRGNIYWTNTNSTGKYYMEIARFDGSERKLLIDFYPIYSLTVEPQKQIIYYFDGCEECPRKYLTLTGLNARGDIILYNSFTSAPKELTVSKDFIYWMNSSDSYKSVWQLPNKHHSDEEPKEISKFYTDRPLGLVANYRIEEQIKGNQDCESLTSLMPTITVAPGYTCERCDVCENHCVYGNCSLNDQGLPKCRCNAGYTGERCEVSACHSYCLNNGICSLNEKIEPVCQCKEDHSGDRCEVSDCLSYCMHGNYSFNDEGLPICSCSAGYIGKRCEISICYGYCLNDGDCSLNEEDEPVCQCDGNHEGSRCEVVKNNNFTFTNTPEYYSAQKNLTLADLLSNWRKPTARISVTVEV